MTTLTQVLETQANKATTVNDIFEAVSVAGLFGVKQALTTGLTFAYFGGILYNAGAASAIADGTVALSASTTNYIEATAAGVVSKNTSGFSPGSTPLYTAVTSTVGITTLTDYRTTTLRSFGRVSIAIGGSPTGYVLNVSEALADELVFTGVLTENETVTLPTVARRWAIYNNTSGSYTLQFKTAAGNGVYVPQGYRQEVYCDGTDIVADTALGNYLLAVSASVLQVGVRGSAPSLSLEAADGTNEGGELLLKGAAANGNWGIDNFAGDLRFLCDGAGVLNFGTNTAKGAEAFASYITIKDSGGTLRKLMVCA